MGAYPPPAETDNFLKYNRTQQNGICDLPLDPAGGLPSLYCRL